jgi:hypothetical protein
MPVSPEAPISLYKYIVAAVIAAVCVSLVSAADADIYKFVDANGVVHYTDVPKNSKYVRLFRSTANKTGQPAKTPPPKEVVSLTGAPDKPKNAVPQTSAEKPKATAALTPAPGKDPFTVPAAAAANGNARQASNFKDYEEIAHLKAAEHNLDPSLVKAVIKAESNWNSAALSSKGAMGLMQLMPGTASLLSVNNPYDPVENIDGGVRYLKYLLAKFNGDVSLALAGYNAGPNAVDRYGAIPPYAETKEYVARVLSSYKGGNYLPYYPRVYNPGIGGSSGIVRVAMPDGTVLYTNTPAHTANTPISGRF